MINGKLHLLFHDLSGPIGSINTLSQICVSYITRFDMEKLEGELKKNLTAAFRNIAPCDEIIIEKLKLVVDALTEIDNRDIAAMLEDAINRELKEIKDIEANTEIMYKQLLESDTKENLLKFAEELRRLQPVCHSMVKTMNDSKEKLAALGKY